MFFRVVVRTVIVDGLEQVTLVRYKVFRLFKNIKDELPNLSILNLLSVFLLVRRILNYFSNYPTHRLYFGEVETPYAS